MFFVFVKGFIIIIIGENSLHHGSFPPLSDRVLVLSWRESVVLIVNLEVDHFTLVSRTGGTESKAGISMEFSMRGEPWTISYFLIRAEWSIMVEGLFDWFLVRDILDFSNRVKAKILLHWFYWLRGHSYPF